MHHMNFISSLLLQTSSRLVCMQQRMEVDGRWFVKGNLGALVSYRKGLFLEP